MGRYSAGRQWEELNRKRQEAENQELAAQKAAAVQAVRAQVAGLPSLTSFNATLPVDGPQCFQDSRSMVHRRQEDLLELEAFGTPPPQYQQRASFTTPPTFDDEAPEVDSDGQITYLQKEVLQKEGRIRRLESEVEVEKDKRRCLQAERHEAVDAQRRAKTGLCELRKEVANLDQLLDGSIKRQRELEGELDMCRQESRELKTQLHEERCRYESDIRARETTRERQIRQQFEDQNSALENDVGRYRRPDQDVGSIRENEAQRKEAPVAREGCLSD
ncbi:MAG: hypothetical protein ALECFALPRED_001223 [Alectoria fallacina]|uniref:Uncharacterized protein n=1 Tax=Alectoria fallacina TaxID=1903189 RepID=A0A8H3PKD0_9LECA|nr:MAG: hypothetical protein ALECFALPRED_001223 [Alectoria fallacina]